MTTHRPRPASTRAPQEFADDDAILLVEAHCRYARTMIKRGVLGVETAIEYLHRLPDACRRLVPDLTGSAPKFTEAAAAHDLLATMPSEKVARALPKLIAAVSPVVVTRSTRIWTGWIAHLLDPEMQAVLRKVTPPSQLRTRDENPDPAAPRRALRQRLNEVEEERQRVIAERDKVALEKTDALRELDAERVRSADAQSRHRRILIARDKTIEDLEERCAALRAFLSDATLRADQRTEELGSLRAEQTTTAKRLAETKRALTESRRAATELKAEIEALQRRTDPWSIYTPNWDEVQGRERPTWRANVPGGRFLLVYYRTSLSVFGLRFEGVGGMVRTFAMTTLGPLVLLVHLVAAGLSQDEAARITRVDAHPWNEPLW
ncbi:MAG: hypothetical protein R3B09_15485 [Nannocystaceae bacterium]